MDDALQSIRELMFRTAIAAANSTNVQHVTSQATGDHTIYKTEYLFLALATVASVLAIVSVLFTFHGFWTLGRHVSMSPIETARAFNAPLLRNSDSNAPARSLLRQVGTRPVKYGVVRSTHDDQEPTRPEDRGAERIDHSSDHSTKQLPPLGTVLEGEAWSSALPSQKQEQRPATSASPHHPASKSAHEDDIELQDRQANTIIELVWLELAHPKTVDTIPSNMKFGG